MPCPLSIFIDHVILYRNCEHYPTGHPMKVEVSYHKLLKIYVLNALKYRPGKALSESECSIRVIPYSYTQSVIKFTLRYLLHSFKVIKLFSVNSLEWVKADF